MLMQPSKNNAINHKEKKTIVIIAHVKLHGVVCVKKSIGMNEC